MTSPQETAVDAASGRSGARGWLAFAIVSVVWGSTYLGIAVAIPTFTPYGMVAVRFSIASLLVMALGRLRGEVFPRRSEIPHLMLVGVLLLGIGNTLVIWSEGRVSSGATAVLCALTPVWTGLLSFRRLPLGTRGWAGMAVGLGGVVLLVAPWDDAAGIDPLGAVALLLACLAWSYGTIHGGRHARSGGLMTRAGVEMATAAVLAGLIAPLTGGFLPGPLEARGALAVLYLAIFGSCVAYTAHGYLSRTWNPVRLGTYAYLNPVIAVLLGIAVLGEQFTSRMGLGMVVILGGVALVQFRASGR